MSNEELQVDRVIDYFTIRFIFFYIDAETTTEILKVDRVIDYLTIGLLFVYIDGDLVNCRLTSE